jgi:diguanylate cyclase (GGDEF)-like protein/PAS domain S-box-containing protein
MVRRKISLRARLICSSAFALVLLLAVCIGFLHALTRQEFTVGEITRHEMLRSERIGTLLLRLSETQRMLLEALAAASEAELDEEALFEPGRRAIDSVRAISKQLSELAPMFQDNGRLRSAFAATSREMATYRSTVIAVVEIATVDTKLAPAQMLKSNASYVRLVDQMSHVANLTNERVAAELGLMLSESRRANEYMLAGAAMAFVALVLASALFYRDMKQAEDERDRNKALLDLVVEHVPATIVVKEPREFRYVLVNRAGERYFGMAADRMIGRTAHEVLPRNYADLVSKLDRELIAAGAPIYDEHAFEMPSQGVRVGTSTRLPIFNETGELKYLLTVIDDITERKRAEQKIAHMAHHDLLTGLPNRVQFAHELERALKRAERGERVALFYLDLDHFKHVNDTLGHPLGDELLRQAAHRLRAVVRETDVVARLGGDEFAVLQTSLAQASDAAALAARIDMAMRAPFQLDGHEILIGTSIGISVAPDDATRHDQLVKYADLALYGAKESGRGAFYFYGPELDARITARQNLERDLRSAIVNDQLELHYQPVVHLQSHAVVSCEALLRWRHPERGMVSPAEFIPVAEASGLITSIGEWVLQRACADAANWPPHLTVAVNLSIVQLRKSNLLDIILCVLLESGLPPERLKLEITESVLIENEQSILPMIRQLKNLGVTLALDDFGTGYSSLSYLAKFPFDTIKIDRSFIRDIAHDENSAAIVQAVATMAQKLGMTTVAEGIETNDQRQKVRELGCTEMQGYLFSPPRPVEELSALIAASVEHAASAA